MVPQCGTRKRDRARAFLRVLFHERPNGLPVNDVIDFAKEEGFGENMTRDSAGKVGLNQEWETIDGNRISLWKPLDT